MLIENNTYTLKPNKPSEIIKTYNIIGRIMKITPKKARIYIQSIDNNTIKKPLDILIDPAIYGELIINMNYWLALEMQNGIIIRFVQTIDDKEQVMFNNARDIMIALMDKNKLMNKGELYKKYCRISKLTERTAIKHLATAIEDGIIEEVDLHTIKLK